MKKSLKQLEKTEGENKQEEELKHEDNKQEEENIEEMDIVNEEETKEKEEEIEQINKEIKEILKSTPATIKKPSYEPSTSTEASIDSSIPYSAPNKKIQTALIKSLKNFKRIKKPSILLTDLYPHQEEGISWLAHMYTNGMPMILADQMGLGKTVQTIGLLAHLYEEYKIKGPHLIVVPLTLLSNWLIELKKFCPFFNVIKFYGNKKERERIKNEELNNLILGRGKNSSKYGTGGKKKKSTKPPEYEDVVEKIRVKKKRKVLKYRVVVEDGLEKNEPYYTDEEYETDLEIKTTRLKETEEDDEVEEEKEENTSFNIILTTYDIILSEKNYLIKKFYYNLIIFDEGHRLKNSQNILLNTLRGKIYFIISIHYFNIFFILLYFIHYSNIFFSLQVYKVITN